MARNTKKTSFYSAIMARLFFRGYKPGVKKIPFAREEILAVADELNMPPPKNLGDVMYSYRYRKALPQDVIDT